MRTERLREMFDRKELFIGTHCQIAEPVIPELMAMQGFDFLWIDTEHSAIDRKDLNYMIMSAHLTRAAVFVRVTANNPDFVKPILEMGPDGIVFPNVRNPEDAERAVASVRYPPAGGRGFGPQRATSYGKIPNAEWVGRESGKVWCITQIEDFRAVDCLDDILAVPGIDAVMCGPYDMSGSLGKLTEVADPEVVAYYDKYAAKAKASGLPVGVSFGYGDSASDAFIESWLRRGVDYICVGSDMNYLAGGAAHVHDTIVDIHKRLR